MGFHGLPERVTVGNRAAGGVFVMDLQHDGDVEEGM